jgi:hypothetical protein
MQTNVLFGSLGRVAEFQSSSKPNYLISKGSCFSEVLDSRFYVEEPKFILLKTRDSWSYTNSCILPKYETIDYLSKGYDSEHYVL